MKKITLCLAVFMLMSVIVTGCSSATPAATPAATSESPSESVSAAPETSSTDPEPTPRGPITMSIAGVQIDDKSGFPVDMDENNNVWLDFYQNELGVTIEEKWVVPTAQADEKMNLQIATGDIPDLMKVNATQYQLLYESDLLEDLTDAYASHANAALLEIAAMDGGIAVDMAMRDGKLLGVPYFSESAYTRCFWIRTDWLENLNIPVPKTMDELYATAKAFVENDPNQTGENDTWGIGLQMSENISSLEAVMTGFNAYPTHWVEGNDGKAMNSAISPNAKKALDFIARLYQEKLIPAEFTTISDWSQMSEAVVNSKCGITTWWFWASYWALGNNKTNDPAAEWAAVYITEDGSTPKIPTNKKPGLFFAVRKGFEYPEIVIEMANKFANALIGPDKLDEATKFVQGTGGDNYWQFAQVYFWTPINLDVEQFNVALEKRDRSLCPPIRLGDYDNAVKYLDEGDLSGWPSYSAFGPDSQYLKNIELLKLQSVQDGVYFGGGTPTMIERGADLDKILLQGYAKYITGEAGVTFEGIANDWLAAGGQKITDEVNAEIAAN